MWKPGTWQPRPALRLFLKAALIALACGWVFSPAFHGGWLWDDRLEITENPLLRDPAGLWKIWFEPAGMIDYFPLKTTVQWVQWRLWHEAPLGYHLSGAGLHLLSALLLWRLFQKLGLRLAWLGGLLFAIHPLTVESVAWISELKNTLSLPPLLLAMCAWLDYDGRKRRADYVRSLLLFLAAMLCKSSVVMFPAVLLLYTWWKHGRITRMDLKVCAAFFAVSLALGLVTVWFQHRAIGSEIIPPHGFFPRLAVAGLAAAFYGAKCVFPVDLLPIYPRWAVDPPSLIQFLPWLLLGAVFFALRAQPAAWGRHVLFGLGFFLVNLLPVLGFVTMGYLRITWVADHLAYLPLVGLIGLAVAGAGAAGDRLTLPLRRPALVGAGIALGCLVFQSHRQAGIFRGEEVFWAHTARRNPGAWLAHHNLGYALVRAGRPAEAVRHYQEALRLRPDDARVRYNLGNALAQAGRLAEAGAQYAGALRIRPDHVGARVNLGILLFHAGRLTEAVSCYEEALRIAPASAEAHLNLGVALLQAGRATEAVSHCQEALRIRPNDPGIHNSLGNALFQLERFAEALAQHAEALRLNPDDADAHYHLGIVLLRENRTAEAIGHCEEAVRLRPDDAEGHRLLGAALVQAGRTAEAIRQYQEVLRLKPDDALVRDYLNRLQSLPPASGPQNQGVPPNP